jgi:putative peptide zinc metalloprotease protein
MATVASVYPAAQVRAELEKKYVMKRHLEVFPLDSSSKEPKFVVRAGDDRSYVISEKLKDILLLFDGTRTLRDVAEALSARAGVTVRDEQMREVVSKLTGQYGFIEEWAAPGARDVRAQTSSERAGDGKRGRSFEFVFRMPLVSARVARPVTNRLTWLFNPAVVVCGAVLVALAQAALLGHWFTPRVTIPLAPSDLLLYYALVVATAAVHELGHAAACRRYDCEHGAIGVLWYIVFPALYVNLSNVWRLSARQRAVVDLGGVYFQLLTTIPLYLIHLWTGNPHCAVAIFSVNVMVLFSLNPILKFDGYWLLVDLSGLVNLRARAWRVVKEVVRWGFGAERGVPALEEVAGRGKRLLLVTYSFLSLGLFTSFILLLVIYAPSRVGTLAGAARGVVSGFDGGAAPGLLAVGRLLVNLLFLLFIYKLVRGTLSKLFAARGTRGRL